MQAVRLGATPYRAGQVYRLRPLPSIPEDRRARDERALFERLARDGDARSRDDAIERFLPLARALALRYQRSGESIDDLLQVASIGLIKAIDRFDLDVGGGFTSYAVPTILGEIKRYFRDCTWAVRVPRDLQERWMRVERAVAELSAELQRQPSVAEIAAGIGIEEHDVLEALQAGGAYHAISFDAPHGSGDDDMETLADSIGVEENGFHLAQQRATLVKLLQMVTARERQALRLRFEQDMTQSEIGAVMGVSQMEVSRIIRRALGCLSTAADPPAPRIRTYLTPS